MGIDTLHCTDIPHMLELNAYFSRRLSTYENGKSYIAL